METPAALAETLPFRYASAQAWLWTPAHSPQIVENMLVTSSNCKTSGVGANHSKLIEHPEAHDPDGRAWNRVTHSNLSSFLRAEPRGRNACPRGHVHYHSNALRVMTESLIARGRKYLLSSGAANISADMTAHIGRADGMFFTGKLTAWWGITARHPVRMGTGRGWHMESMPRPMQRLTGPTGAWFVEWRHVLINGVVVGGDADVRGIVSPAMDRLPQLAELNNIYELQEAKNGDHDDDRGDGDVLTSHYDHVGGLCSDSTIENDRPAPDNEVGTHHHTHEAPPP